MAGEYSSWMGVCQSAKSASRSEQRVRLFKRSFHRGNAECAEKNPFFVCRETTADKKDCSQLHVLISRRYRYFPLGNI
ncbi:MAG: hypothetical protein CVU57_30210 [Deltaproteobacteria bacterium HGW-Deltaproteobacteria-15]|nr:MAG: hypothetical protein CVU57_30210 [Deltaproteobacteria bacterium HGW-Deltaproteobacteria-15]